MTNTVGSQLRTKRTQGFKRGGARAGALQSGDAAPQSSSDKLVDEALDFSETLMLRNLGEQWQSRDEVAPMRQGAEVLVRTRRER